MNLVRRLLPQTSREQLVAGLKQFNAELAALGVTATTEPGATPEDIAAYMDLWRAKGMKHRVLNNAGIFQMRPPKSAQGWDATFATDYLGPFLLTQELIPHLPDGANVVFIASGVEDPERKPAKASGFRGGRYISAEASARGEWKPGGSTMPGADAYATSKQCLLAAAMECAREMPRPHFCAVEPGFSPGTALDGKPTCSYARYCRYCR